MKSVANFGIVYSAAFGGGIEMAVEPSHRVGLAACGVEMAPLGDELHEKRGAAICSAR